MSQAHVGAYMDDGIVFPFRVLSETDASHALELLEELEAADGGKLGPDTNLKPHILIPWISDLVRNQNILDIVEACIGPNILCWSSNFFIKNPNDGKYITWHQDSTYWNLSSADVVTAWLALTPSTQESGCMQVIPGTHMHEQVRHRDTYAQDNLLSRGQEIEVEVDQAQAVDVVLRAGEMSLHHVKIFHGSGPNRSAHRRIGLAIRYIPTRIRQLDIRTSALLVRGRDEYGHFDPEPIPQINFDPSAVKFHGEALRRMRSVLYAV